MMPQLTGALNKNVGFFRFKKLNGRYLLTNDVGEHSFLSSAEFTKFIEGRLDDLSSVRRSELLSRGFLKNGQGPGSFIQKYSTRHDFLSGGTSLHIVVVTLRCDHGCLYCQTSSRHVQNDSLDMSQDTARQTVDRIFESPSRALTIEFQGGEPLLNFETIRFIVEYATEKNKTEKRNLLLSLVSNLASLTQKQFDYLVAHQVSICTSLDGPRKLQSRQRISLGNSGAHAKTLKWFKKFKKSFATKKLPHHSNALTTVTRYSFPLYKEIVDEYIRLGLESIHLRPANPFGLAKLSWEKIGFSADEFLAFYKKTLDYIIAKNLAGKRISERTASIFLKKILTDTDPNYVDMRSPCGAGTGQLAYNFDGGIYACDEGRMLGQMGDDSFKIGHVATHGYKSVMESQVTKTMCIASCLDNLAGCQNCAYRPYCGVCPVYNLLETGNIFGREPHNDRCRINKGILDYIFEKLACGKYEKIFQKWIHNK